MKIFNESIEWSRFHIVRKDTGETIDSYTERKDAEDWIKYLVSEGDFAKGALEIVDSHESLKESSLSGRDSVINYLSSLGSKFTIFVSTNFSFWYEDREGKRVVRKSREVLSIEDIRHYLLSVKDRMITDRKQVVVGDDYIEYTKICKEVDDTLPWKTYTAKIRINCIDSRKKKESVKYPNGQICRDDSVDMDKALDYQYGTDRDPDNSNYTEEEKQRALDYYIKKTEGGSPRQNLRGQRRG